MEKKPIKVAKKKRLKKPVYRPRYDVFVGQCSVFILDKKSKKTDIVCAEKAFTFNADGSSNARTIVHRMRVKCARINREDYLQWMRENGLEHKK